MFRKRTAKQPLNADTTVVTSQIVAEQELPIRLVIHFYDDEPLWTMLSCEEGPEDEGVAVHAEHLLTRNAGLEQVRELPQGAVATRYRPDDEWHVRQFRRNEHINEMLDTGEFRPTYPTW